MKAFCLALILANLGFFAWAKWRAPGDAPVSADWASDVPPLVLASEAQNAAEQEGLRPTSTPPTTFSPTETSVQTDTSAQVLEPDSVVQPLPTDVARCISVGPFNDLPEATQAAATLRAKGLQPRTREREGDVWAGLWVYIDNIPSRAEAQSAMRTLKERGITDAYIMPSTDRTLDISLGIFTESVRAQRLATEVRALGFTPKISDRTRKNTVYWLDTDVKATDTLPTPADVQSDAGQIVRLEVRACPAPGRSD